MRNLARGEQTTEKNPTPTEDTPPAMARLLLKYCWTMTMDGINVIPVPTPLENIKGLKLVQNNVIYIKILHKNYE